MGTEKRTKTAFVFGVENALAIVFASDALMELSAIAQDRAVKHLAQLWLLPVFLFAAQQFPVSVPAGSAV